MKARRKSSQKLLLIIMNINYLETVFKHAKSQGLDVCIEVTIPNQDDTEYIINRNESIENKLSYYKKVYDEKLVHKNCKDIKIVGIKKINFTEVMKNEY